MRLIELLSLTFSFKEDSRRIHVHALIIVFQNLHMEFEKNHIDTLHYRWSYILSLISLNLQQRQDRRWWNWSCTTERGTCKEIHLHSKESRRQFIHNQHRESHSPQVRESFIRNRWRTLKIQSWRAAAADIPSRFSERFSRFSKILTRHNHIALRQIRFIFSHDLPWSQMSLLLSAHYPVTSQPKYMSIFTLRVISSEI